MKKYTVLLIIIFVFLTFFIYLIGEVLTGCSIPSFLESPPSSPEATFTITSWEQDYYEYLEEYSSVEIYYEAKNIGEVDIDFFQVLLEVTCIDDSKYTEWDYGSDLLVGITLTETAYIDTAGKEASSVKIINEQLETY